MKIYKVLGKRGRITLPLEIRQALGFSYNDIVSFEQDGETVAVRREKICNHCKNTPAPKESDTVVDAMTELLDGLTAEELRTALIRLSVRWAEMTKGGDGDA